MAKSKKKKDPLKKFVNSSYGLPTFSISIETYDPIFDVALLREGEDGKLRYFRREEKDSEEYEIEADTAWADFGEQLFQGAISHDIIPAAERLLEADGWKHDFDTLYNDARDVVIECNEEFSYESIPSEAIEYLPKTHDDWLAKVIQNWEKSLPIWNYNVEILSKYEPSKCDSLYPCTRYKHDENRFAWEYNQEKLFGLIESYLQKIKDENDVEKNRSNLKKTIHYIVALSPARKNNQEVINTLAEYKRLYPQLISEALTEATESLQSELSLKKEEYYLAEIAEFINQIDEAVR
ncbi:MAG: hypothetical protein KME19_15380 [Microcoleus vaginatus WJT46-NPBG5]|jgi:hypothetical protein|nr:hypothetical protein [Microcoleus vaginatus WJT46-NPBG5]